MLYLPVGMLWPDGIYLAIKLNEIEFSRMSWPPEDCHINFSSGLIKYIALSVKPTIK